MNAVGIDLVSLIEQKTGLRMRLEANHRLDGPEYWGPCPWCGVGDDRFHVWPESSRPHYWCRICGKQGSAPWFLVTYCAMTYPQALAELGLEALQEVRRMDKDDSPCQEWMDSAEVLVHLAQKWLWSSIGVKALAFLHARGLTDETIRACKLGYIPVGPDGRWRQEPMEKWGLPVTDPKEPNIWLYSGILVPWYVGDQIWKLEVRKLVVQPGKKKMPSISGSHDCLYNINALQIGQKVGLCESAFDAIVGNQMCQGVVTFFATGGAKQAQQPLWVDCLKRAGCVLVAFDNDEPGTDGKCAGDEGALFWTRNLPNAARAYPWAHDINDMLIAGMDIHAWATNELEGYDLLQAESQPSPAGDPPISIVQDAPPVDPADPGQSDNPIHPAIRAAMRLCQQGIIFRLEDDCLVVYYRPAVAEEVELLYEHRDVLTDWVRSIRQKETGYTEAAAFYEQFCAQPGYGLRLREDNKVGVTVPESVSDADFERIVDTVCAQGDGLKQVLKQRSEKERKQEPAAGCCKCASPVEYYSPGGHAYCTACYRCAGCNQMPRWVYDPERDLQVCACVMEASHRVTRYTPYTLSAFSRTNCPHHVITLKDNRFRSTSCKGKTLEHGWCADHAYAHELLCLGAALGYPAVHGDYRHIEQRVENWEAYAACTSAQHAAGDVARIRTRYRYHAPLDLSVPVVQKTTQPTQWAQSSVYTSVLATRSKLDPTTSMDALV